MTYQVMFSLLPNGFGPDGRARLSLVASPRPPIGQLGDSEVLHWPDIVAGYGDRLLVLVAGGAPIEATVTSPRPDPVLWAKLFSAGTPVKKPTDDLKPVLEPVTETQPYADEYAVLQGLYAEAMATSPTSLMSRDHPVIRRIAALNVFRSGGSTTLDTLLDPARLTRDRLQQATALLRTRGSADAADIVALVPRLRRIALTSANSTPPPDVPKPPGPVGVIAPIEQADFAQVTGALLRHPQLALRLGLRIDLTIPAFTGPKLIRIGRLDGQPLNGPEVVAQPWSAVVSSPELGRFVMATEPDERAEIVNGMLDLRPVAGPASRYVVSDVDVTALGQQLDVLATRIARSGADRFGLPVRRPAGLTVAQVDRRARRFQHMLERNARFAGPTPPAEVEGAPVLYADDVNTGYRVDVSADRTEFRSLMRRVVTYSLGSGVSRSDFTVADEGLIDPFVPTQQIDNKNKAHVFLGEELFGWNGWGFGGPVPGPVVGAENGGEPDVVTVDPAPLPGFPLKVTTRVEEGTLTPLRFGRGYRFRVRAVDLAGNSVEPAACDPTYLSAESVYRRYEPVPSPAIVPRARFRPGEALTYIVVYSDGDGNPTEPPAERHLAAPKTDQRLAELHGVFDPAFGKDKPQSVRDQMLDIALKEQGTWLDPAPGIAVVNPDPAGTPTPLPVPRGEGLAAGEYVVHDTDAPQLPYLPDVAAGGVALAGLPGTSGSYVVPWTPTSQPWPARPPVRLVVRPAPTGATRTEQKNGRQVVTVDLPPAQRVTAYLSSVLSAEGLSVMEGPLLSPAQEITLVHAVRKPLVVPTMTVPVPDIAYPPGTSSVSTKVTIQAHAPSTGKVALEASWKEYVDRGYGPVVIEDRHAVLDSAPYDRTSTSVTLQGKHDFGDAKRRVVTYRPLAVSRFAEHFPAATERELIREGVDQPVNVIGRIRPHAPAVHSLVPLMAVTRHVVLESGLKVFKSQYLLRGVRAYLHRPWYTSGEGELLGVLVAKDLTAGAQIAAVQSLRDKVSRYGRDLYEQSTANTPPPALVPADLPGAFVAGPEVAAVALPGLGDHSTKFAIAGYPVAFDDEREHWYADVTFPDNHPLTLQQAPFLRLGVVAYQPTSYVPSGQPGDLRSSTVTVLEPTQLTPSRGVTAKVVGPDTVELTVNAPASVGARVRAKWQVRKYAPAVWPNPSPDMCVDSNSVAKVEAIPTSWLSPVTLTLKPPSGTSAETRDQLRKGRIVVEEYRQGWSFSFSGATEERVVFTEVIELQDILM